MDDHHATPDWSVSAISTDEDAATMSGGVVNRHRHRHESGLRNYHPSEESSLSTTPDHDDVDVDGAKRHNGQFSQSAVRHEFPNDP